MRCSPTPDAPPPGSLTLGWSPPHLPDWQPAKYSRAPKPAGGFALLPLDALVLPWLAYEQGVIAPLALRGYLACIEMRERRCQVPTETAICYTTEELQGLLGAAVRPRAAAAVRQILCATGLVAWPDDGQQCTLCPQGTAAVWLDHTRYTALRAAIHPSVHQLPLPRRLVTWLAQDGAPGLIATALGVACRTLRYRAHQVTAGGSLVAAWVSETFQIARRTVAYWLHRLRALHWIAPIVTPPAHRQAYGPWVAVNLRWCPPRSTRRTHKNLAPEARPVRKNIAGTCKNLASASAPSTQEHNAISIRSTVKSRPYSNPVPDTPTLKHHTNLRGDCVPAQGQTPDPPDPAAHYATLPPDIQASLYHDAEARLHQQYPADFVIRPMVLAEVYRLLETPRLPVTLLGHASPIPGPSVLLPDAGGLPPPLEDTDPLPAPFQPVPAMPIAPEERPHPPTLPPQAPPLEAITPRELADVARLRALWQQVQARGWVGGSDADWRTVVTAAQHALRVGSNPGGLFVTVLRQRAWHLLTQADEDAAQQVLRAAHGPLTASERAILRQVFGQHAACPPVPPLSHAAHCAREALRLCQSARWAGDPFTVVKAAEPAWTRACWEAALAELEQYHLLQQVANAQQQRVQAYGAVSEAVQAVADESAAAEEGAAV